MAENLDFLNLNSFRSFPIKEGLTRKSIDAVFTLPDSFLVDAVFSISSNPAKKVYVSKINNYGDTITVDVSDEAQVLIGNFNIVASSHTQYQTYVLQTATAYAGASGRIVVNSLADLQSQPYGAFLFTIATTELEARTVIPSVSGMNRIIFKNVDGSTFSLTGDIVVEARSNVKFSYDLPTNKVSIDVGDGLGLNSSCEDVGVPIKTINGIGPDVDGNFILDFADCASLTVLPSNTGLLLNDICCKPCIGCDEIGTITDRLISLESNLITLKDYYQDLQRLYNDFKTTVTFECDCEP